MSGGACVILMSESLKLDAPSPMLENCLRMTLQNPLVVERVNAHPEGPYIYEQLGPLPQWDEEQQTQVQRVMKQIVRHDLREAGQGDD